MLNNNYFKNLPPEKEAILKQLLSEAKTKSSSELLPFLLSIANKSKSQNVSFTNEETEKIISILTANMSEKEKKKVELLRRISILISKQQK